MATLQGRAIKDTYKDLLQVSNSNNGVDGSLRTVEDGEGTSSALKVSSQGVQIAGTLDVTGDVTGVPHVDYKGSYSSSTAYIEDDVVVYNGSSYIAKGNTTGNAPTNTTYWGLLAQKGANGTDGTNGTNGTNGATGPAGPQGPQGQQGPEGPEGPAGADGSSTNLALSENADTARSLDISSGSTVDGLMQTNFNTTLRVYLNANTGTTDSATRRTYKLEGLRTRINETFSTMQAATLYIQKFHNQHRGLVELRFETDIVDPAWQQTVDERWLGWYYIGVDAVRTWEIQNLTGAIPLCNNRSANAFINMHIKITGKTGTQSTLAQAFEGGYILLSNGCAFEFGGGVHFWYGMFFVAGGAGIYNEANPLELKNDLGNENASQMLYVLGNGSHGYFKNEVLFSGQFQTARFIGDGSCQFHHALNYQGTSGSSVGPFVMETNYSLPQNYIDNAFPAFSFEAVGGNVFHAFDPVLTDTPRNSNLLGQAERFDRFVVTNFASQQYTHLQNNKIAYSHGANGEDPTQTNIRGWALYGVNGASSLPAKKTFQII
jgi:hypothetical protein